MTTRSNDRRVRTRRPCVVAVASVLSIAVFAIGGLTAQSAVADTAPREPDNAKTPTTVAADVLPTPQIGTGASQGLNDTEGSGVVWDQLVVGNTVYVGGSFTHARPYGAGANESVVDRGNFLSYDIRTGELLDGGPSFNQTVRSIAVSPDQKTLYVGGMFDKVDGEPAYRVAAFDVTTGKRVASFKPSVNASVKALVVTDSTVYMAGNFTSTNRVARSGLAAVDRAGKLTSWAPKAATGTVSAMQLSPSGDRLLLGGNFLSLNGSSKPGYGMGIVRADMGASLQDDGKPYVWKVNDLIRNGQMSGRFVTNIQSFASDGKSAYATAIGAADGGSFEGVFKVDWADGAIQWIADCHGDTYSVALQGKSAYFAGHTHDCLGMGGFGEYIGAEKWYRGLAVTQATTGTLKPWTDTARYRSYGGQPSPSLQHWFPAFNTGKFTGMTQGPWDVAASGDYVLYGGEFTTVNGVPQRGLARFAVSEKAANTQGPQLSGADMKPTTVVTFDGTGVIIRWPANYDRDNSRLTYQLMRDGTSRPVFETTVESNFSSRPIVHAVDTGLTAGKTYTYRVRTIDPLGNATLGAPVTYTAGAYSALAGSESTYDQMVLEDQPATYWPMNDTNTNRRAFDWAYKANIVPIPPRVAGMDGKTAVPMDGRTNNVWTESAITPSSTFSMELWFKTSTTSGGLLMGFSNQQGPGAAKNATPTDGHDRQLYMDDKGRINFEVYDVQNKKMHTVTSPSGYSDGGWHHVVTTVTTDRVDLYVDGKRQATGPMTGTLWSFSGYWGIGGHQMYQRVNAPTSNFIAAHIDNVATYDRALPADDVARHHAAGVGLG